MVLTLSDGRAEAVNILTVTPSGWPTWEQRFGFWVGRRKAWQVRTMPNLQLPGPQLKRFNFLYTATFVRVGRFPRIPGGQREPIGPCWVLFCSNFIEGWETYFQAFLDGYPEGISALWGEAAGFPHYHPSAGTRYKVYEWSASQLVPSSYYYSAYPNATNNDIRNALRVQREVTAFAFGQQSVESLPRSGAGSLLHEFGLLSSRLRPCLGPVGSGRRANVVVGPPGCTGLSNVVSLMPIRDGCETSVRAGLEALPSGEGSPFREIEGTHFARMAVIDRHTMLPLRGVQLRNSWLLFAADFDGEFGEEEANARRVDRRQLRRFVNAVAHHRALRPIWDGCVGRDPGSDARSLGEALQRSVIDRLLLFRDYPDATLAEITTAIDIQQQMGVLASSSPSEEWVRTFLKGVRTAASARWRMSEVASRQ